MVPVGIRPASLPGSRSLTPDMRKLELYVSAGEPFDTALSAIRNAKPVDYQVILPEQKDRRIISIILRDSTSQNLVDALQQSLEDDKHWRIAILPIEATIPKPERTEGGKEERNQKALREELLHDIEAGAKCDRDYLIMVALSTIVAAVGLNSDGVAAVIGAMVIAPLLGPILGFSMGAALGDVSLIKRSSMTLAFGILLATSLTFALSFLVPINLESRELITRAEVRLDGLALALAAGGAAALSVARGQSSALVGVMVAAALLPPGAAFGLFLGAGEYALASRAGLLLALNVAALVLAALAVFRLKKIRPRTWIEQRNADFAVRINAVLWIVFLIIATSLIVFLDLGAAVDLNLDGLGGD